MKHNDLQFLEKIQKLIRKLPKRFANCKLRMANSNPDMKLLRNTDTSLVSSLLILKRLYIFS